MTEEEKRAKEMEDALNWLRDNDLDYDDWDLDDVQSISAMSKMKSVVAPDEDKCRNWWNNLSFVLLTPLKNQGGDFTRID